MKNALTCSLVVAILWLPATVTAQNLVIKYDGTKKVFKKIDPKAVRVNENYSLELQEVHNGLFDVSITINDQVQISTAPDILKFLSIPSTEELKVRPMPHASGITSRLTLGQVTTSMTAQIASLENLEEFLAKSAELNKALAKLWKESKHTEMQAKITDAERLASSYFGTREKATAITTLQKELHRANLLRALVDAFAKDPGVVDAEVEDFMDNYSAFLSALEKATQNSGKYGRAITFVFDVMKHKDQYSGTGVIDPIKNYYNLWSNKSFSSEGDLSDVTIHLINKIDRDTVVTQTLSYFTFGKLRFDFSTGFYYTPFRSDSYSLVAYNADSSMVTLQSDYAKDGDLAIGAQLHFSYKFAAPAAIGLNVGCALSPFDGTLRYLGGVHLMIGQRKQLIISYGRSLSKVKRISDAIAVTRTEANNQILVPVANKEPKLVDKYEWSHFVGISYNLSAVFKPVKK